jgi:acetoin utilization protein AcuC
MAIAILYREELKEYDFGSGHPFRGDRYEIFPKFLRENLPEDDHYRILKAEWATDEDLSLICQKDYIDFTRDYFKAANLGLSFDGKFYRFHSADNRPIGKPGKLEEAARLIIGQAKLACDLIQQGEFKEVVSLGGGMHHASQNYGDGFCIYNDVAFAAKYLIEKYGLERILILDTDAHAGNGKNVHTGTCGYFYSEPRVLFIDLHQDPSTLYPGAGFASDIGEGKGRGFTINVSLPMFAGDDSYKLVFEEIVEPVTKEFKPQIIIRNGGSDPHFADELTQLGLSVKGFQMIGEKVRKLAEICDGKVIDLIGSGYNKKVLTWGWLALIAGLANFKIEIKEPLVIPRQFQTDLVLEGTKEVIKEVKRNLKNYWKCF